LIESAICRTAARWAGGSDRAGTAASITRGAGDWAGGTEVSINRGAFRRHAGGGGASIEFAPGLIDLGPNGDPDGQASPDLLIETLGGAPFPE
jgi:hypothetical protein